MHMARDGARPQASRLTGAEDRGERVRIEVDGVAITACMGETIATALLVSDISTLRTTVNRNQPRGLFCCMGVCYECLVTVNDGWAVRACMTPVAEAMKVSTGVHSLFDRTHAGTS
jgi:predicted molibdopterin-dependent oxidoreductase YjgC